jgi:hypothetical protein
MPRKPHPADVHNAQIVERATAWSAFTQAGGRIVRRFETRSEAREAAQLLADQFRRPALVYAIDASERSAVADTVQPGSARYDTENNMTTRTFSKRFNAQRAARGELGAEAQEGVHFRTTKTFGGWMWLPVKTGNPAPVPAEPASKRKKPDRDARNATLAPDPSREPRPSVSTRPSVEGARAITRGKRAAIEEAARQGQLPTPPDFSKPTHARFRTKLAKLVELAEAGDVEGLKAFSINPISTSPKAMARYRDLAVIALQARSKE